MEAGAPLARPAEHGIWSKTGHEEPVFLDRSGRRRPAVRAAGLLAAAAGATWLAALVTGAMGFAKLPAVRIGAPLAAAPLTTLAPQALIAQSDRSRRFLAADRDVRALNRRHKLDIRTS